MLSNGTEIRISQYADDTIIFTDGSERSLNGAVEELTNFSAYSGLKINWEKTSCLPLGSLIPPESNDNVGEKRLKWVDEIKILGVHFRRDISNITDLNLEKKFATLEQEIAQWKRRHLTPLGKITVIKSSLLSKLVHLFTALPNPSENYVKKLNK